MSRSESGSNVSSCFSADSDNERSTNRDLVIPSPVELSDSDGDVGNAEKIGPQERCAEFNVWEQ
jgi:hypothetical protein